MDKERPGSSDEKPIVLREIPDRETLEQFLRQMNGGEVKVMFDIRKGVLHWVGSEGTPHRLQNQTWD